MVVCVIHQKRLVLITPKLISATSTSADKVKLIQHMNVLFFCSQDRGSPPRNSTTNVLISVLDNDDLSPKFSQDVYRTQVTEFYPLSVSRNVKLQEIVEFLWFYFWCSCFCSISSIFSIEKKLILSVQFQSILIFLM
jgi:hypothetical protein